MELFSNLSSEEIQKLHDAPAQVTVLVAGADGNIDPKEIAAAEKVTQIRSFSYHEVMKSFYETVNADFQETLDQLISELPADLEERQAELSSRLTQLNPILAKLDHHIARLFYETLLSLASHVAKASGGIIGMFTINNEEKKVIELPMITPIVD